MSKKVAFISLLITLSATMVWPQTAFAHFRVADSKTGVNAVFHVTPNHDPVAGKSSVISFDFTTTQYQTSDYVFQLRVIAARGNDVSVPIKVAGNVVFADYDFPSRGYYSIQLQATNKRSGVSSRLQYGQRVTRGVVQQDVVYSPAVIIALVGSLLVAAGAATIGLKDTHANQKGNSRGIKK